MTDDKPPAQSAKGSLTAEHIELLLATSGPEGVHEWLTDWVEQGFPPVYVDKSESGDTLRWKRRNLNVETFQYEDAPEDLR